MKKLLYVTLILAAAALVMVGCNFGKTYSMSFSGSCMEVTTTDLEMQTIYESAGYVDGTCSRDNVVGVCTYELLDEARTTVYYDSNYTRSEAENACNLINGKFTDK